MRILFLCYAFPACSLRIRHRSELTEKAWPVIRCCLEWIGVAGPLELLVLDIGQNSNFCFVVKCFVEQA